MPWKEMSAMAFRLQFITEAHAEERAFTDLCADYGVSRKTGYKWMKRMREEGVKGLEERPRIAKSAPHALSPSIEMLILWARLLKPHWGGKKLREWLLHAGVDVLPSVCTFTNVLRRHGASMPRHSCRRGVTPYPGLLVQPQNANDLWVIDFKGDFVLGDGSRCYPLTLMDAVSRFLFACDAFRGTRQEWVRRSLERVFREYGLPLIVRSDNGVPFVGPAALAGLSTLSVWFARLGIWHERSRKGAPQDNGRLERLHATLKGHTTVWPKQTLTLQQAALDSFRDDYNFERPHEALDFDVPGERYCASPREFPEKLPTFEYDVGHEVRRVASGGFITWRNNFVFLAKALSGENIGMSAFDEGRWLLRLGDIPFAVFDERTHEVLELAAAGVEVQTPKVLPKVVG